MTEVVAGAGGWTSVSATWVQTRLRTAEFLTDNKHSALGDFLIILGPAVTAFTSWGCSGSFFKN